jgi:hypothetical protein
MNIKELRQDLLSNYESAKNGNMAITKLSALSNTAGRIIQSARAEMEYKRNKGDNSKIPFLETKYE